MFDEFGKRLPAEQRPKHGSGEWSAAEENELLKLVGDIKRMLENDSLTDSQSVVGALVLLWKWEERNGYPLGTPVNTDA